MGVFKDYEKAVWDVEHNNCTLGELEAAEQRLKDSIVEWHPYPKEKPTESGEYNVTVRNVNCVMLATYDAKHNSWEVPNTLVIAWTDLLKPYEEGAEE